MSKSEKELELTAKILKDTVEGRILVEILNSKDQIITLSELRERFDDNKKVSYYVNRLARVRLIKEFKIGIGRSKYITLTDKGKKLAEKIIELQKS